jgi:hypothetical protein
MEDTEENGIPARGEAPICSGCCGLMVEAA